MFASFVITFREALEAFIIVGLLLSILNTADQKRFAVYVWAGTIFGVILSIVFAFVFERLLGGFEGAPEAIYEGVLMIIGFLLISHVVLWMRRSGRQFETKIKDKVEKAFAHGGTWALLILALTAVVREGIETVIFLKALSLESNGAISIIGAMLGIITAIFLILLIYMSSKKISPKRFFQGTGIFLIFVAAGLLAHGISELQESGFLPLFTQQAFDFNHILSEEEGVGSFLEAIFGYDANPSLLALAAYVAYLIGMFYFMTSTKPVKK